MAQIQNYQFLLNFLSLMRQVSMLLFLHPAKVRILQRFILLLGFSDAPDIPGLFDAIGLDAAQELVAIR